MAVNPIYRESWQKANGWNVRVEFIAGGGEASKHGDRSVTDVNSAFLDVSGHKSSFGDGVPYGLADGESCKFVIDYEKCPVGMKSAVVAQAATVSTSSFAAATVGKYRTPKYMPQSVTATYPRQPNLFMVWSDRGTSNGIASTVVLGGQVGTLTDGTYTNAATASYLPGPMDTITGTGLTVTYTVSGGIVTTASIGTSKGTGFKVGDQVYVGNLATTFAYFTVTAIEAPTWSLEFAGCQRLSPSTKYATTPTQMRIEIEAIGVHKIAMESITDLTTFTRQYMFNRADSAGYEGPRYSASNTQFPSSPYGSSPIYDFAYCYDTSKTVMLLNSSNRLLHWHAPLGAIFGYLQDAFDEAFEFFMMEGYQGGSDNATNIGSIYPTTTSRIKLMRPKAWDGNISTNVQLGETDGTLHDSASELTQIRFIFAVTKEGAPTFTNPDDWVGGLFTDFEDGLRKDCDSAWDLLKKMCEQFFLKLTPYYEFTGGLLKAKWNSSDPYATTFTASTISYTDTASDSAFESNAETRETVKQHYFVTGEQADSVEVTSYTKSGKKIEMNNIFDIRYRTTPDDIEFVNDTILAPYINLRGLFLLAYAGSVNNASQIIAVSPTITASYLYTGNSTYFTFQSDNKYSHTSDPTQPNYTLYYHDKSSKAFMQRMREIQTDNQAGFGLVALFLASYFGVPVDTSGLGTVDYSSNNQTAYEMTRPLSTDTIPQMLGQRIDITPHAALTAQISEKAYAVDIELDWTAKDAMSDYVKVKYLTRNIRNT